MKNSLKFLVLSAGLLLVTGCSSAEPTTPTEDDTSSPTGEVETPVASAPEDFGLDYVAETTTAKPGETVLAPAREFVDAGLKDGVMMSTYIFYNASMNTPGSKASTLNTVFESGFSMPNALIVPIPANQTAQVGDVVLTWWQSGSGMQRAIVVAGGTPEQPMVRYLDLDLDNPAKNSAGVPIGEMEEQLAQNSFYVLKDAFQVGTTVAYPGDYSGYKMGQIVSASEDKLLVLGFAGSLQLISRGSAIAIPVKPSFAVGDVVQVEAYGSFQDGTVTKLDAPHGRVYVEFTFGGQKETVGAPYGNVVAADAF